MRVAAAKQKLSQEEAADQAKAVQILQDLFGRDNAKAELGLSAVGDALGIEDILADRQPAQTSTGSLQVQCGGSSSSTPSTRCDKARRRNVVGGCDAHELSIPIRGLSRPLRLLEAIDSEEATRSYKAAGENDPFGAKVWPSAAACAERLVQEGVRGRTVLELGCGTGLASIAAMMAGASFVMATDLCQANVDRTVASARLNGGGNLQGSVFDVTSSLPLPALSDYLQGGGETHHHASRKTFFDFVVFSDVLYWPEIATAFGQRVAEAFLEGSSIVLTDPGRRRDDFMASLRNRLVQTLGDASVLPPLELLRHEEPGLP
eukprot:TRINITY_DN13259_c0_g1_i2.p1 TRINITY_DN13259_c0_g1~~TRINITY_DN13259_c0_g1_i2.p1  ORF type:complete len:319 (+),score=55.99 TRINITY_DN13259_c0_g1_i2:133-1089(+)